MAFEAENFIPLSSMANSNAPRQFGYQSSTDDLATVKGANYFDDAAATTGGLGLQDGDVILVKASDVTSFLAMSVTAGAATVGSANDFA